MEKDLITDEESVHTVCNKDGNLMAILRRDPVSKKHLVYFVKEGTADDIVEKLIKTDFSLKAKR